MKSVAVFTATTGRPTLQRTVDSIVKQTYGCEHYIINDGVAQISPVNLRYQTQHVLRLPKPTGGSGIMNGAICAMAAYVATEDYICFCDDDNWYEPNHIQSLMEVIGDAPYAYSLRRLVLPDGSFFANDDAESLGHHGDFVDVNCYLIRRDLAMTIAPLWYRTNGKLMVGDRFVWQTLRDGKVAHAASGKYTVNYTISANAPMQGFFFLKNIINRAHYPDGFPWAVA